jgi:hypothetical protein
MKILPALKKLFGLLAVAAFSGACLCLNYVDILTPDTPTPTATALPPTATASPIPSSTPTMTSLPPTKTPTSPPPPTATSSTTPIPPPGTILLQEDFDDPGSGWEMDEFEEGSIGYASGTYFVESVMEDQMMWGLYPQTYRNTVVEVDTLQVTAPSNDNNAYGVMCRTQENDDGYLLRISGDGLFSIAKVVDGEFLYLVDWTESGKINQGNASNTIRAACESSTLRLFINGELAAEAVDETFSEGLIGLTATSYEEQSTRITFDNLVILQGDNPN